MFPIFQQMIMKYGNSSNMLVLYCFYHIGSIVAKSDTFLGDKVVGPKKRRSHRNDTTGTQQFHLFLLS